MESVRLLVQRYLKATWERRWLALSIAWIVCALGWAGVYMIPNQYESSARLYVDADAVLTPLLKGVAADSTATSQLDILQRTLLSGPNLQKLISATNLDLSLSSGTDRDRLIQQLASDIKIRPQTKTLFTIDYRNPDPQTAYNVVQKLLTIFIENASGANRDDMENARRFIDRQIAAYEVQLRAAERRRAEFRLRYLAILPQDDGRDNAGATRLDQMRAQVVALNGQLQDAIIKRDGLKQALASTPPTVAGPPGVSSGGGGSQRLAQAEEQLRDLRLRYTDSHPDVIATRDLVASLRSSPPSGGGGRASAGGAGGGSTSSVVYEQMKLKLVDADASVTSLKRQLDEATKERDAIEELAKQAPGVQAEYKALDRDYAVLKRNFDELLQRREAAQLAQAAETQANKVKLTIVDPPQVPRIPVSPNRVLLLPVVLLAGLGAGVGVSFLLSQFDRSFRTIEDLRAVGLPVLGGISALGASVSPRRIASTLGFCVGLMALVVVFGGLLAYVLRSQALV